MEKVKQHSDDDIQKILNVLTQHDSEIGVLSASTKDLKVNMEKISTKLDSFHSELLNVLQRPQVSLASSLTVVKDVFLIVGLIVGGIVYVASASYEARMTLMEERHKNVIEKIMKIEGTRPQ